MPSIDNLLNKISDFKCEVDGQEIVFPDILQKENRNIVLNAKVPIEQCRKMRQSEFFILGSVSGREITLVDCYIKSSSWIYDNAYFSIIAVPNEIIVGGLFSSAPMVKEISASTSDLNRMFSVLPLKENVVFTEDNPSMLEYTFPKPIIANDKYGKIEVYPTFGFDRSVNSATFNIVSVMDYCFTQPLPLMEAVAKISALRNLFSFFGNGYISLGDISFGMGTIKKTYDLWLNYTEDLPAIDKPYLIRTSKFEDQFQQIWEKWLSFYESAHPIISLFYEINCNRSTGRNSFLNLSQAIEVYLNVYRGEEVKEVAKKDINNTKKKKSPTLKHRYQDILSEQKDLLKLIDENIADYATGFSNMRNYYTHYNLNRYVEPSFVELYSATRILRFLLLVIVYTVVGFPSACILECKEHKDFNNLDGDLDIILKYSHKKVNL